MLKNNKKIIISRTDSIGDVVLTLPIAGILKHYFPNSIILFLGDKYTKDVVNCSEHINEFIDYSEIKKLDKIKQTEILKSYEADTIIHVFPNKEIALLAKQAKIPTRIGTSHRLFHWNTCNKLVNFSRKKSPLHESQLNTKLLLPIVKNLPDFSLAELNKFTGFSKFDELNKEINNLLDCSKKNIILHPKSKGSAREWGFKNFAELINELPENKYKIFITGTENEKEEIEKQLLSKINKQVYNLCGMMNLSQFVSFIKSCDILIACSTGPLHIASIAGVHTIGIFPPIKPMHPNRWQPIGEKSKIFVKEKECNDCRKTKKCECILSISPKSILNYCESESFD
ncbi:glycosyltransferase family 9 protein [Bacteroidales bacterium OttesenSCG-928-I21]|nr:glycosyltransferase family 9 protein [Bacteroidales bacterium OttesenSCG-928-I21]